MSEIAVAEPTFDQQLLLWLGDEPEAVQAKDAALIRTIASEFARLGVERERALGQRRRRQVQ